MLTKIVKLFGFTLIELLAVMVISSILGAIGLTGYMQNLRVERRQDAILSMQKALLNIQITQDAACLDPVSPKPPIVLYKDTTNQDNCFSSNAFYHIHYNASGHTAPTTEILNSMLLYELLILKATAAPGKSQTKDTGCESIYLSNENKIYPSDCVN